MPPVFDETVFVFDLDDTLYQEADYRDSGLREICSLLQSCCGISIEARLCSLAATGEPDLLGAACRLAGLPASVKESLLWAYRLHLPNIRLSESAKKTVQYLEAAARVAVLTDGRAITQRLKLKALGLAHLPVYISEEYGSVKPEPQRFEQIMSDMPAQCYMYVADNPSKDFLAANALGWLTVGLRGTGCNIHSQATEGLSAAHLPGRWIDSLNELLA